MNNKIKKEMEIVTAEAEMKVKKVNNLQHQVNEANKQIAALKEDLLQDQGKINVLAKLEEKSEEEKKEEVNKEVKKVEKK